MGYTFTASKIETTCAWCQRRIYQGDGIYQGDKHSGDNIICEDCGDKAREEEEETWK